MRTKSMKHPNNRVALQFQLCAGVMSTSGLCYENMFDLPGGRGGLARAKSRASVFVTSMGFTTAMVEQQRVERDAQGLIINRHTLRRWVYDGKLWKEVEG